MSTFPATTPVPVVLDLPVGSVQVVASERDDVVVTVLPADADKPRDVRAAEQVNVEKVGDTVTVTGPRWNIYLPFSGTPKVTIELPIGCDLNGSVGTLFAEGQFGAVNLTVSAGDARIEDVGRLDLKNSAGSVIVGRVTGPIAVKASAASVRINEVTGDGTIRCANGTTTIGSVTGSLQVNGAHADVAVGQVRGNLTAKTASGGIRVDRIESGSLTLTTSYGSVEVGVPEGTAAWLDASSQHGTVRNLLNPSEGPADGDATAEVHANTSYGDVIIRRP